MDRLIILTRYTLILPFQLSDITFHLDSRELNFVIQEVMGLEVGKNKGLTRKDIGYLMDGRIKHNYSVSLARWSKSCYIILHK